MRLQPRRHLAIFILVSVRTSDLMKRGCISNYWNMALQWFSVLDVVFEALVQLLRIPVNWLGYQLYPFRVVSHISAEILFL